MEENNRSRIKWIIILGVCAITMIVSFALILHNLNGHKKSEDTYAEMRKENAKPKNNKNAGESEDTLDFSKLKKTNSDIYAWIKVEGTKVDYPILMSNENESTDYYLNHNIDHSKGYPGCLFVDKVQAKDFSNYNTIIYGHNNYAKGTMFHELTNFYDKSFFKENQEFEITTEEAILKYKIYAAVKFSDDYLLYKYDFTNPIERSKFVTDLANMRDVTSHVNKDVKVSETDHLVTLSTCISPSSKNRYLVVGVLVDKQDKKS